MAQASAKNREISFQFHDSSPEVADFHRAVIDGLSGQPRRIPPKFFYDDIGSRLFDAICEAPEYYPTRTERALLQRYASQIGDLVGPGCFLVEPGSGNCQKVRLLLDAIRPAAYVPMDISCGHLKAAAQGIARAYEWLEVHAVCADITNSVELSFIPVDARRVLFYPGSSIGNFDPDHAMEFLRDLAGLAGPRGSLLIGVDLRKDARVLDAAYNDTTGVTAEFNLNLLHRINRELDGDIDLDKFDHRAFYNESQGRIEMHLVSNCQQTVRIDGHQFDFCSGDGIHTENSYKYTVEGFQALAERAGFAPVQTWTDSESLFSLHFLRVKE